ncbi:hypothetical protein BRD13_07825 [Halobacteriales archaeon SW_5_70_135]|nr:MAG: hypothetical protein BRD13_07825 [Halobacteriales archaeon SW_5_70_135]
MAEPTDDHVCVSEETKARLRQRERDDESFDDVVTRFLDKDRDLLAGFGAADDRAGETLAETVARRKKRSRRRMADLAKS